MTDDTEVADHTAKGRAPDYELDQVLYLETPDQFKALFDDTRLLIIELLSERAATTTQLAETLEKPKGTIGYHLEVLHAAGLVKVIRTEKVRALEAKYYGRTARTFEYSRALDFGVAAEEALLLAAEGAARSAEVFRDRDDIHGMKGIRHARISEEQAEEFERRLWELMNDFITTPRDGDVVYALAMALYPTDRPHLPE